LHFMLNGQRVNNPSSPSSTSSHSLSLYLSMYVRVYTTSSRPLLSSLFLVLFPRGGKTEAETEKGDGTDDGNRGEGGVGTGREGLGIASCIGEHKRSRNNTIGKRARHRPTRARTFRAPTRVALPRVVRAGIKIKKKKCAARIPFSSKRAYARGVISVPVRARTRVLFLYVRRTQNARDVRVAKISARFAEGRLEGRPFFIE